MLLFSTVMTALMMYYALNFQSDVNNFEMAHCLLFGAIISATDPVAVVALLKELGVSKRISTLIEGESLFNDGTALVLFLVLQSFAEENGDEPSVGEIIGMLFRMALGGPALGILFGIMMVLMLQRIHN